MQPNTATLSSPQVLSQRGHIWSSQKAREGYKARMATSVQDDELEAQRRPKDCLSQISKRKAGQSQNQSDLRQVQMWD